MLKLAFFLIGSIGIIIRSRPALGNPGNHGFPRFFAFEAILGLVIFNASAWFTHPFSPVQLISWGLLILSAVLVIYAIGVLHRIGKPDQSIQDDTRLAFEKTTQLVTAGPYRLIRHPMYASLLYLAWGVFLKQVNFVSALLAIIASLALYLTAVYEERENLRNFGDEYANYMQHTRRFIPHLF